MKLRARDPWGPGRRAGASVVGAVAGLLLINIWLAKRIAREATEIQETLDRVFENTPSFFDLPRTNSALERMTSALRDVRTEVGA